MLTTENENWKHSFIPLCCAMNYCLLFLSFFTAICSIFFKQHFDNKLISSSCSKMDSLWALQSIPVFTKFESQHGICKNLSCYKINDAHGLLQTDKLKNVHIVFKSKWLDFILCHEKESKAVNVIMLNKIHNFL